MVSGSARDGRRGLVARAASWLMACLVCVFAAGQTAAHEVPVDARVNIFVKPQGNALTVLVRAPLGAMTEIEYPLKSQTRLVVSRAREALRGAAEMYLAGNMEVQENGVALPRPEIVRARATFPSDRSFASFEAARALLAAPDIEDALDPVLSQLMLDVELRYPIASEASKFAMRLQFDRLAHTVAVVLRFLPPGGETRAYEFHNDPGLIHLDPGPWQAASTFVVSGFWHILEGTDHLLFLLCLVVPFRRWRPLVAIVTAFTIAHSISLVASALGFVTDASWFPPLVETLIAATIVYMALENIVGSSIGRRWVIAFAFGLIHGFGFSFALKETMQFAGDHLLLSLVAFNVGVEIGQLCVLAAAIPVLTWFFKHAVAERMGVIVLSALVAHTAWHWMIERWTVLAKFPLPRFDALFVASLMRGAMALLALAALVWIVNGFVSKWAGEKRAQPGE